MTIAHSIGHPYIHTGINCDGCGRIPIKGYRYCSQRRADIDFCGECYFRQPPLEQQGFLKIERADNTRPFQIHYIECQGCGAAPIEGPRYRHKVHAGYDLCAMCFVEATSLSNPNAEPGTSFELLDQSITSSGRKRHYQPVYHFGVHCKECQVSPICGPRYSSIQNFQYDICLLCFDHQLVNGRISVSQFRRIERPDSRSAVHVLLFCCNSCGATPICGPAYMSSTNRSSTLCLMCFLILQAEEQELYTRVEPPRQANSSIASASGPAAAPSAGTLAGQRPGSAGGRISPAGFNPAIPPAQLGPGAFQPQSQPPPPPPQFRSQQQVRAMAQPPPSLAPYQQQQPWASGQPPQQAMLKQPFQQQQLAQMGQPGQMGQALPQLQQPDLGQQLATSAGKGMGQQFVKGFRNLFSGKDSSSGGGGESGGGGGGGSDSD